ncbi:hypothetical protein [Halomonas sp. HL-93]|uniref:hypothetical protein n=1 Tax=Halomonas sp. HL-93 TaxID=1666906 RepID=UPI0006D9B88D|nr:hypothetical protein [Halomonas sp. HL-93]KPQ26923.1 MAG: hypothetical protein HLUCCO06_15210 [Halomonas sp. HL-93]SBR47184.1 hypothetical protein GA0071314_1076 [Halomonas sp. HL-93]
MTVIEIFGVVSGGASIIGLVYALYYAKQNRRQKILAYHRSGSIPLASVKTPEKGYDIYVVFKPTDQPEQRLKGVHVSFVRFANFGTEPIRRNDIASANPLQIAVDNVRILDISLTAVSREVCQVELKQDPDDGSKTLIDFDFLDYEDGALLKILTEDRPKSVRLEGDIIGMPRGIKTTKELGNKPFLGRLGVGLSILLFLSSFAGSAWLFHWAVGSWSQAWVLILPIVALILPGAIIGMVASTVWPDATPKFSDSLQTPSWFGRSIHMRHIEYLDHEHLVFYGGQIDDYSETKPNNSVQPTPKTGAADA